MRCWAWVRPAERPPLGPRSESSPNTSGFAGKIFEMRRLEQYNGGFLDNLEVEPKKSGTWMAKMELKHVEATKTGTSTNRHVFLAQKGNKMNKRGLTILLIVVGLDPEIFVQVDL